MANEPGTGGVGGAHMGPAMRRRLHLTLPGERTLEELAAINALRVKLGLQPEGGPVHRTAQPVGPALRTAMPVGGDPAAGVGPMLGEPGAPPIGVTPGAGDVFNPHGPLRPAMPAAPEQPAAAALLAHLLSVVRARHAPQRRAIPY